MPQGNPSDSNFSRNALGEDTGTVEFHTNPRSSGFNSLIKGDRNNVKTISVEMARLDDLLPDERVDVIKIDIEGAELGALRGGRKLFIRNHPVVMFESGDAKPNSLGYSAQLLWNWFTEMGYEIYTPDRFAHYTAPLSLDAFLDAHQYPRRTVNYFAVPTKRLREIRDRARQILDIS